MQCLTPEAADQVLKKLLLNTYTHKIKWVSTDDLDPICYETVDGNLEFYLYITQDKSYSTLLVREGPFKPTVHLERYLKDMSTWDELVDLVQRKTPMIYCGNLIKKIDNYS